MGPKRVFYCLALLFLTMIVGLLIKTGQLEPKMPVQRHKPAFKHVDIEIKHPPIEKCINVNEERDTYLNMLHFIVKLARMKKWTHFIQWGSLLGSWRHHGMIPCDEDLDMYFELKDRDEIMKTIATQKEFIAKQMLYPAHHKELKLYSRSNSTRTHRVGGLGQWNMPYMDLYFFKYTTNGYVQCVTQKEGNWSKTDIFPLQKRPFEDMTVPAPRNTLKILQKLYGMTDNCEQKVNKKWMKYKCRQFDGVFPFVHRNFSNGTLIETLKLGAKIIQVKKFINIDEKDLKLPQSPFTLNNSIQHRISPKGE
jgi:hypothetical protein